VTLNDLERRNGVILRYFGEFGYLPFAISSPDEFLLFIVNIVLIGMIKIRIRVKVMASLRVRVSVRVSVCVSVCIR